MNAEQFTINCTGDVVTGDTILFTEAVWPAYKASGRFGRSTKSRPLGERTIVAEVLNDSYGEKKQQHTFTLRIIESSGYEPLESGSTTTRKGRNVYKNETRRLPWSDESKRDAAAEEKHTRGDKARKSRTIRRELQGLDGQERFDKFIQLTGGK